MEGAAMVDDLSRVVATAIDEANRLRMRAYLTNDPKLHADASAALRHAAVLVALEGARKSVNAFTARLEARVRR
jgi:hypothetical protein